MSFFPGSRDDLECKSEDCDAQIPLERYRRSGLCVECEVDRDARAILAKDPDWEKKFYRHLAQHAKRRGMGK